MAITFEQALEGMQDAEVHAPEVMGEELLRLAQSAIGPIQQEWPVATGRSRAGFKAIRRDRGGAIVNDVDYAEDVHDGLADELIPRVIEQSDPTTIANIERDLTARLEVE